MMSAMPSDELILAGVGMSGVATYPPGATFGPRAMRDYEFVWIIEGRCEYRWGELTVPAPPGAVVLCRPGQTDFFRWDAERRTRHGYFHFMIDHVPRSWPKQDDWPLVRPMPEGDILRPMFRYMLTWSAGDQVLRDLTVKHMLRAFVTGQLATRDVGHGELPDAVERAEAFIHEALDRDAAAPLELEELSDAACVTPEHLCRLFKKHAGRSPMETVRLARLDRAATLLARSNYSIGEIAHLCGFASQFHFSGRFKRAFGKSPTQVRDDVRKGEIPPLPRLLRVKAEL